MNQQQRQEYNRRYAELEKASRAWRTRVENNLRANLGLPPLGQLHGGNPPRGGGGGARWLSPGLEDYYKRQGPHALMTYGQTPQPVQVESYIKAIGGNPYKRQLAALQENMRSGKLAAPAPPAPPTRDQLLQEFLDSAKAQEEAANAANEERYQDILGRLEDRYDRNMGRVSNYGKAARQDLIESSDEALRGIQANLANRGLGSSTIFDAFRQRSARDLAREKQRLSEQVDRRAAEYDQALSKDIAAFMERRTDEGPNQNMIAELVRQFGSANDGRGYNAGRGQQRSQRRFLGLAAPSIGVTQSNMIAPWMGWGGQEWVANQQQLQRQRQQQAQQQRQQQQRQQQQRQRQAQQQRQQQQQLQRQRQAQQAQWIPGRSANWNAAHKASWDRKQQRLLERYKQRLQGAMQDPALQLPPTARPVPHWPGMF